MKKIVLAMFLLLNLTYAKEYSFENLLDAISMSCYTRDFSEIKEILDSNESLINGDYLGFRVLEYTLTLHKLKPDKKDSRLIPKEFYKTLNSIDFHLCQTKVLDVLLDYDIEVEYLIKPDEIYTPFSALLPNTSLSNKEKIDFSKKMLKKAKNHKKLATINLSNMPINVVEASYLSDNLEMFRAYLDMGLVFEDTLFYIMTQPYFKYPKILDFFYGKEIDKNFLLKIHKDKDFQDKKALSHQYILEFIKFLKSKKIYFDKDKMSAYAKVYEFMKAVKDKDNVYLLQVFVADYIK
ncbi:hypothetical protein CBLAS_0352 [Campylobacter blaseri]|uniref:Uncharacterized protein n=1 Tax=Campylobacter blaseri TaxID=2042961 RepID=A0A2P8R1H7_9BACT|nr:hypothetical protein [Campylobacter blaseri]PSM52349.1 hypothetical protein CQ405_04670 [Campylobacter blaseri]PSM54115.1 hypothetical protein CRN67_04670 [Campylobacter blaseri]QKF85559.1 hypothetical protein CBLAS_0352 [Campylobacter blaseri]